MPNATIRTALDNRYQNRMPRLAARVTSRPQDSTGRGLGYVVATIANQAGVHVAVGPDDAYYPGDSVLVEQRGGAAAASYVALGWQSGTRPNSGDIEITADTTIGGTGYSAGDRIWGNPFAAHFYLDYDEGQLWLKSNSQVTGCIDAAQGLFIAGDPGALHGQFGATGIEFRNGSTVLSGWDATGRSIYGVETLGRPLGPGIQQKEVVDPDTGETRYVWQVLGLNGVPGVAFVTGTESDPDNYKFYIGPTGAAQRLSYENGALTVTGTISAALLTANAGSIAGWDISADQLRGVGSSVVLDSDGIVVVNNQAGLHGTHATWRIWAGATLANIASAPFRVDKDGGTYITSLKSLAGSTATSWAIDVEGSSATYGGIHAVGGKYGVYGEADSAGAGVKGFANDSGWGVEAGATSTASGGLYAYTAAGSGKPAIKVANGPIFANGQDLTYVNRIYFDATRYLYLSGSDIYWYDGATGTKLN